MTNVYDSKRIRALSSRFSAIRADLLRMNPFFGKLLLRLRIGYSNCGTAFTDAKQIVFDPDFADNLSNQELSFVLLHEVLHCVLNHCTRGRGLMQYTFNIACDIIVNSIALESLGLCNLDVNGHPVMHLTPMGHEGREYTAEAVYEMLMKQDRSGNNSLDSYGSVDDHSVWEQISESIKDVWNEYIKDAINTCSGNGIPSSVKRHLKDINYSVKVNWKQLLHDFIQNNRGDYVFTRPDRRFQGNVLMPSFVDSSTGSDVEGLWVLIDTSGSISDEKLAIAYDEIRSSLMQIDHIKGLLSFFDDDVSNPIPFESIAEIDAIEPVGGGGTNFNRIFERLEDWFTQLPTAVIILTDGEADYPDEGAALGVPVMWIVIDSNEEPPWGVVVHVE